MTTTTLALYYYDAGLMPIPVRSKVPLIQWGECHLVRPDRMLIEHWFQKYTDASIGLVTGPVSNTLALDIDGDNGRASIGDRALPATWHSKTPRGGDHYIYALPQELVNVPTTITALLPNVDVRGTGGYIVAVSGNNDYHWEQGCAPWETDLAPAPQWLVDAIKDRSGKIVVRGETVADNWLEKLLQGVDETERHPALAKLAGYYFSRMHPDVAAAHLRDWNAKNNPPYPDDELEYQIADIRKRYEKGQYSSTWEEQSDLEMLSAADVLERFSSKIDWLVEGLIPKGTITLFAGWQGRGKSWMVADLATEIARGGGRWCDQIPVVGGSVLYVDNENAGNLVSRRLSLLLPAKGIEASQLKLHFFIRNRMKLTSQGQMQHLKTKIAEVSPTLVVVDSFASCHTLDENSSKDMRFFFDDLIAPLVGEFGCSFLFIDHEAKGQPGMELHGSKRLRGSGAKGDAADVVLSLNERDGRLVLEHSKPRYARKAKPMVVSIDDVDNGVKVNFGGYL